MRREVTKCKHLLAGATHTHASMREVIWLAIGIGQLGAVVGEADMGDTVIGGGEGVAAHTVSGRAAEGTPLRRGGRGSWGADGGRGGGGRGDIGSGDVGGSINEGEGGTTDIPGDTRRQAKWVEVMVTVADGAGEGGKGGGSSLAGVAAHGCNGTADMKPVATL